MTVTGSPGAHPVTPAPTASIVPLISWPKISGVRHPGIHVAVQDVQVGAAETGEGDPHLHLARPRRRGLGGVDADLPVACVSCGEHRRHPLVVDQFSV